jgi:hypothetical protein
MGRPPIGKVAMTNTERSRRRRAGLATTRAAPKPATKPDAPKPPEPATKPPGPEIAWFKSRIVELEAKERAMKARIAELEALPAAKPATAAPERVKLGMDDYNKLVRRLHPDAWAYLNDETLTDALKEAFQIHQRLFEPVKEAAQRERKRPVDWREVENALKAYAEGKTKVTMNKLFAAVYAQVPHLKGSEEGGRGGENTYSFIARYLMRSLGFTASRSGLTYERTAPTNGQG